MAGRRAGLERLVVALLVVAAPVGVYLLPEEEHAPAHPASWDSRVTDLVAFVERERELRFEHPVAVEFLSDEEFRAKVTGSEEETEEEKEELERFLGELRALGLVSGDPDLDEATDELLGDSVVGLYSAEDEELFVRGEELTPYVRGTLVHELTHALQDQHFDLEALEEAAPAGAEVATSALIEGDAVRIETAWVATLSEADREAHAQAEEAASEGAEGGTGAEVPQVLEDLFAFPYVFGPTYLSSLSVRGNEAVDAAFRDPPVSEAQVVDPVRFGPGFEPVEVEDPELPDGSEESGDPGAFGQFTLYSVLGPQLGHTRAWSAVTGWQGDRYVGYEQDGRDCLAVDVVTTDDRAAETLRSALAAWGEDLPRVTVQAEGREVRLRTCDPGSEVEREVVQPRAFEVMATRAQAIDYFVQEAGLGFRAASCVADTALAQLGPELFVQDEVSEADQARAQAVFQRAFRSC